MKEVKEPTVPGWYRSVDGSDWMLFSLNRTGQWCAHAQNGDTTPCTWDYVAQAGRVTRVTARSAAGTWVAMLILLLPIGALAFWLVSLGIAALS